MQKSLTGLSHLFRLVTQSTVCFGGHLGIFYRSSFEVFQEILYAFCGAFMHAYLVRINNNYFKQAEIIMQ